MARSKKSDPEAVADSTEDIKDKAPAATGTVLIDPFTIPEPEAGVETLGRAGPVGVTAVAKLAESIVTHGQLQPIRYDDQGVISGATRVRAGRMIRDGFTLSDGKFYQDKEFLIRAEYVPGVLRAKERFLQKVKENVDRNNLSLMDEAEVARTLKESFKYTKTQTAALFGYNNPNRVSLLLRLEALDAETIGLVKAGKIGLYPAIQLLTDVVEPDRPAAIEASKDEDGNVVGAKLKDWLREQQAKRAEAAAEEAEGSESAGDGDTGETAAEDEEKAIKRTIKNVEAFFGSLAKGEKEPGDSDAKHDALVKLGQKFLAWVAGEVKTERPLYAALDALHDAGR